LPSSTGSSLPNSTSAAESNFVYKFYPKFTLTPINASGSTVAAMANEVLCDFINVETNGLLHTGFVINGCVFDWNNSARVSVRPFYSSGCILAASIKSKGKSYITVQASQVDQFIKRIVNVIVKWNSFYDYDEFSTVTQRFDTSSKLKGNCQLFVQCIFDELELVPCFPQAVVNYMDQVKKKAFKGRKIKLSQSFMDTFFSANSASQPESTNLQQQSTSGNSSNDSQQQQQQQKQQPVSTRSTFPGLNKDKRKLEISSHKQLDSFLQHCLSICSDFKKQYRAEYELLKSFDRGYWMNYYSEPNMSNEPLATAAKEQAQEELEEQQEKVICCPFNELKKHQKSNSSLQEKRRNLDKHFADNEEEHDEDHKQEKQ